jgi:hypothetical protein
MSRTGKGPVLTRVQASTCALPLPAQAEPDVATWPIARDVSQRVEPDVRSLGRVASAFIAEKTRRLSIPLTDDVLSQHFMRPVHSAGRRRPGHPADGVPVQSIVKQYARAARCTVSIVTYTGSFPCTPILRRS